MPTHRMDRVRNLLRQAVSQILGQVKDPRVGFVTVTDTEVSPDLRHAKVFVSILGDAEQRNEALKGLESARGFVRRELHDAISLRHIPELVFLLDKSLDHGMRINELLQEARKGSEGSAAEEAGEAVSEEATEAR